MSHVMGNMEVYSQQTAWPVVLKESDLIVMWGSDPMTTLKMGWGVALNDTRSHPELIDSAPLVASHSTPTRHSFRRRQSQSGRGGGSF